MKKKILVINLGWEQVPLLERLSQKNLELFGIHSNPDYYRGVAYAEVQVMNLRDLGAILEYALHIKPDYVISDQCDYSQFAQAVIAERLGLPGPKVEDAQMGTNKLFQRMEAVTKGILIPEFHLCRSLEETREAAADLDYPLILKPVDNRGSFGVNKVSQPSELERYYFDALVNSHSRLVLAERFIHGVHITVDGYAFPDAGCKSLALATKKMLGGERQVAVDILYPGELDKDVYFRAMQHNETVNNALGFRFGMLHSEYMITNSGEIYLIEVANRGGGVYTSEIIVPAVSGIDLVEQYCNDCCGGTKSLYSEPIGQNRTLLKFLTFAPGRIRSISGLDQLDKNPEVLKYRLSVKPGDEILPVTTDANRHGFFILRCDGDIRSRAEDIVNSIIIEYEPTES